MEIINFPFSWQRFKDPKEQPCLRNNLLLCTISETYYSGSENPLHSIWLVPHFFQSKPFHCIFVSASNVLKEEFAWKVIQIKNYTNNCADFF